MVEDGCAVEFSNPTLQALIDPELSSDGTTMSYNQFGFVDDSDDVALNFELSCTVKIGTAPTCSDNGVEARRQSSDKVATIVTIKSQVNGTGKRVGNLAVSGNNQQSSAAAIFASTTLAAGLATLL